MSRRVHEQSGFTLLEALIAIALLAGIAMALLPALNAASKASTRIRQSAAFGEDIKTTNDFFRDIIEGALWIDGSPDTAAIAGGSKAVTITTIDATTMAPVIVKLTITPGPAAELTAQFAFSDDQETNKTHVLLSNLEGASFEYLSPDAVNGRWTSEWDEKQPPKLIRLKGAFQKNNEQQSFLFEASPIGSAPLHCQFDSVSRRCR